MPTFNWITLTQAQAALAARLADPGNTFWTLPELTIYICEALRTWNALTEQWNSEFPVPVTAPTQTTTNIFISSAITILGFQTVTASGVAGMAPGTLVTVDAGVKQEVVSVVSVGINTFTAVFTKFHLANTAAFYQVTLPQQTWYNLSTLSGSPRQRTLTDAYLYTAMQYHLLEPPTGAAAWTGTSQFALADLQFALQRARDEMIQSAGCNLVQIPALAIGGGSRRAFFPDTVLEPIRARFIATAPPSPPAPPFTITREDSAAFDAFETGHLQTPGQPQAWSVVAEPPLAMDLDVVPNVRGSIDVITLQSGPVFAPPAATLLGVPDDWSWVVKWGALADLLGRESEATDRQRADYCLKRYMDGLKIMRQSNWLLSATIANVPVDTPSLREMDAFSPEWELDTNAWPSVVTAGIDFCAVAPLGKQGMSLNLVGNAPVPTVGRDFVQIARDTFDTILDYAQRLATFKMGGAEFSGTEDLEKGFFTLAAETNKRLAKLSIFRDMLGIEGKRQQIAQPR